MSSFWGITIKKEIIMFLDLMLRAGFYTDKEIAAFLGLSTRTIRRYRNQHTRPPVGIIRLLTLMAGDIGQISPHFNGWIIKDDLLIAPNNESFNCSRLEYIRSEFAENHMNKIRVRELEKENSELKKALPKCEILPLKKEAKCQENISLLNVRE